MTICLTNIVAVLILSTLSAGAAEFHVAPTGSDANPGTNDKPFASLEKARDAIRAVKSTNGGKLKEAMTVVLHGGEYVLKQTFELTPRDSGEKGKPVRYVAAKGENPVISSARGISGWNKYDGSNPVIVPAARGNIWFADISKGWRFHNLYINGMPQQVARTPNTDVKNWQTWPRLQGNAELTPDGMKVNVPPGLVKGLSENGDVEVNFLAVNYWNVLPVLRKVDGDTVVLASRNPCTWVFDGKYYQEGSVQFRNALACIDEAGEWCVDSNEGKIYFWPPNGTMDGLTATAPVLHELVRLQGDDLAARTNDWRVKFDEAGNRVERPKPLPYSAASAFTQLVRHVEFDGLGFEYTDRLPEDKWPEEWLKRNAENPDGALFMQGVETCAIRNCIFRNCGAYAVVLDHYAQAVSVIRNEMHTLGSGGVQASGYGPGTLDVNGHHIIRRNYIHGTGRDYMHSAAMTIFGSRNNDFTLNWIADCPYAAVQISGANHIIMNNPDHPQFGPSFDLSGDRTAQYQLRGHELPTPNNRNDPADFEEIKPYLHNGANWIARNFVDEFMTTMADGAALYCWSVDHGNVWSENLLKRMNNQKFTHAAYMDDWTGRTIVHSTIAWAKANWLDNSHITSPAARAVPRGISPTGLSIVQWRDNTSGFPDKPAGYDERMELIVADAALEGGWPDALERNLAGEPDDPEVGTWIKAVDACRCLNGPPSHEGKGEVVAGMYGGVLVFGPYQFLPDSISAVEIDVGVDPQLSSGKLTLRVDSQDGPVVGTSALSNTGGLGTFKVLRIPLGKISGEQRLFFTFEGSACLVCHLKRIRFVSE